MQNNAIVFAQAMVKYNVTPPAISAMLGNFESESTINPGRWEGGLPYVGGYGLAQWTPYTNYSDWAGPGWENNGKKQTDIIIYHAENNLQWGANNDMVPIVPPITLTDFLYNYPDTGDTNIVGVLAYWWEGYYERPLNLTDYQQRQRQAIAWYKYLHSVGAFKPYFNIVLYHRRVGGKNYNRRLY